MTRSSRYVFIRWTVAIGIVPCLFFSVFSKPTGRGAPSDRIPLGGTFDDDPSHEITSDGLGEYQDGVDGVQFGHQGSGSRFDTASSKRPRRWVHIDLSGIDFSSVDPLLVPDIASSSLRSVDARFVFNDNDQFGLKLKDLAIGESGTVGYHFDFDVDNPHLDGARLNFGRVYAGAEPDGTRYTPDETALVVTRTGENSWTYAGTRAALEVNFKDPDSMGFPEGPNGSVRVLDDVEMSFVIHVRELP